MTLAIPAAELSDRAGDWSGAERFRGGALAVCAADTATGAEALGSSGAVGLRADALVIGASDRHLYGASDEGRAVLETRPAIARAASVGEVDRARDILIALVGRGSAREIRAEGVSSLRAGYSSSASLDVLFALTIPALDETFSADLLWAEGESIDARTITAADFVARAHMSRRAVVDTEDLLASGTNVLTKELRSVLRC